jgi:hypothetical protein
MAPQPHHYRGLTRRRWLWRGAQRRYLLKNHSRSPLRNIRPTLLARGGRRKRSRLLPTTRKVCARRSLGGRRSPGRRGVGANGTFPLTANRSHYSAWWTVDTCPPSATAPIAKSALPPWPPERRHREPEVPFGGPGLGAHAGFSSAHYVCDLVDRPTGALRSGGPPRGMRSLRHASAGVGRDRWSSGRLFPWWQWSKPLDDHGRHPPRWLLRRR